MSGGGLIAMRVAKIQAVSDSVKCFRFVPLDGSPLPVFSGGSHVVVAMRDGERLRRNPYSLMNSPADRGGYEISVLRVPNSRGGSHFMHDRVAVGDTMTVGFPVNLFPLDMRARRHILVAGGIGITPFIPMAEQLSNASRPFELHYAMRDEARGAYAGMLRERHGRRVHLYRDAAQERICVDRILENQPLGAHFYVCGPDGMIESFLGDARRAGWPEENLHAERFIAPPGGEPFRVRLANAQLDVDVGAHESLLEAIERCGLQPPFLCRGGACGACETGVLGHDGELVHNDHFLRREDREAGRKIMICVSRLAGRELVLDL